MQINYLSIIIAISAALVSGMGTAIIASLRENKKEERRRIERDQDLLKMDLKDLKIELYKIEKELTEWKDKYYKAIQDLIEMKSELDSVINQLNHLEYHEMMDTE